MKRQTLNIETIKQEEVQGFEEHKGIMLEALKEYRNSYIENIHPIDEYNEEHKVKVSKIDEAIKFLERKTKKQKELEN